ncbi:uridine kinase family protein [Parapedobacter indicus]|uniref:Uridine kinase n=1 Tax=Parapedobacter indicus TaxID=1477437 RepID=A0A1I3J650_9SPHI|nr:P-loop NTPase fold protein [Parapedobacter indicus]PPL02407.1 uridine kinase [Parapedobacter indicus]SFI55659.1 uridine kinase [Parapedobacter indicus]
MKAIEPYVVGIAGSSGSGKTFFLNCFINHFSKHEVALVSQDDYYIPAHTKTQEENKLYNFDLPTAIDRDAFYRDIRLLFEGQTVYREEYTFNNPALKPKIMEIKPAPVLIVEGLFIFFYEEINDLLNHRIFLHAEEDIALQRRLKRDFIERGYLEEDVRYKWVNHVMPAYRQYLLPFREQCDRILINNTDDPAPIIAITDEISAELRTLVPGLSPSTS